jgi:hypothetical protein
VGTRRGRLASTERVGLVLSASVDGHIVLTQRGGNVNEAAHDATPTLFDWAGGEEQPRRLMDAFYDRVEADELLSPYSLAVSVRSTAAT